MFAIPKSVMSAALLSLVLGGSARAELVGALPGPVDDGAGGAGVAVVAGGCFWGVQGVFEHVKGVQQVLAGYAGGAQATAQYGAVSTGGTGHAESVQIRFDPRVISYGQILRIFFSVALDPTEVDRQGPDSGSQYRSEIFYADEAQKRVAQDYIAQLDAAKVFSRPIATRVDKSAGFFAAEAYHQDYLLRHPESMYIVMNDLPKIAALKRLFPEVYLDAPVTVAPARTGS